MHFSFFHKKPNPEQRTDAEGDCCVPRVLVVADDGTLESAARLAGYVTAAVPGPVGAAALLRYRRPQVIVVDARAIPSEEAAAFLDYARRDHPTMRVWVRIDDVQLREHLVLVGAERFFGNESPVPLFEQAMQSFLEHARDAQGQTPA